MRALLVLLLLAARARADECSHDKRLPVAQHDVIVDGKLDEWEHACWIEDFEQKTPKFHAPPTHRVRAAVAIHGEMLYIAARMWGPSVDDALTARDDTAQAERFIVSLDPSNTKRLAFSFAVTAAGTRADWIHTDDDEGARDASWNPIWRAVTVRLADGWQTEMAIPLSQLRLPREPATSWGIDFDWYIPSRNEDVFWRAVPPDRTAWASYFGALTELPPVKPRLALELLPYASTQLAIDEKPSGPFALRFASRFQAGLDAKLRPLPGLTIAATVNPDFGQVEADPAFVNLTAYEVQLPEKRPFFIENNSLFNDAWEQYFYSRRIGGLPLRLPAFDELGPVAPTRILGAVAAGGYVAPRTQIAALAAVTDETDADAIVGGRRERIALSPLTAWGAARVEQQLGNHVIGATATLVERDLPTSLKDLLPQTAFAGGGDVRFRTDDNTYELDLFAGMTALRGAPGAIAAIEMDSAHFFQRPGQTYLHLDGASSLVGMHAGTLATKRAGAWQATLFGNLETAGLDFNDIGALASADDIDAQFDLRRFEVVPSSHFFEWDVGGGVGAAWNTGGMRKPTDVHASANATLPSFAGGSLTADVQLPGGSDDATRGGPIMDLGWASEFTLSVTSPRGRAQQLSGALEVDASPTQKQGFAVSASLASRLAPPLRLDLSPSFSWFEHRRQYVETIDERYLFGHVHRKEASLTVRATWALSPDLVFTMYAQPFYSLGRYSDIGEAAGGYRVRWYDQITQDGDMRTIVDGGSAFSIAEPNFRVLSLRSTAVLRWEPSPGTTMYLVWQQSRETATDAIHTIAIKLSLWFG